MAKSKRYRISFDFVTEEAAKDFFETHNDLSDFGDLTLVEKDSLHDANFKVVHWLVRTNKSGNGKKAAIMGEKND